MVEPREGEERRRLHRSNGLQSRSALFYGPDPIPNPRSDGREGAISQCPPAVLRLPPQVPAGRRTAILRRLRSPLPPPRGQPPDLLLLVCCISPRRLPPLPNHQGILRGRAAAPPLRARRLLQGVALQLANGAPLCELVVRKGEF